MADAVLRVRADTSEANRALGRLQTALAGLVTAGTLKTIVGIASSFEDLQTSLKTVTRSAELGQQAFDALAQFSVRTQFSIEDLSESYIQLAAAGISPTTELLTTFTNAAAITTDQLGSLQAITALYARTTAGGLGLEELNRLADRGIPVFDILNEKLGISRLEISRVGQTAEGARSILNALGQGINERFGTATADRVNNLSTKFSNLKDQLRISAGIVGRELAPALKAAVSDLTEFLQKNDQLARQLGMNLADAVKATAAAIKVLADNFDLITAATVTFLSVRALGAASNILAKFSSGAAAAKTASAAMAGGLKSVSTYVTGLINPLTWLSKGFAAIRGVAMALFTVLRANPIGAIVTAIVALISYTNGLGRTWAQLKAAIGSIWEMFTGLGNYLSQTFAPVINFIKGLFAQLVEAFKHVVKAYVWFSNAVIDLLPDVVGDKIRKLIGDIQAAGEAYDAAQAIGTAPVATEFPKLPVGRAPKASGLSEAQKEYQKYVDELIAAGNQLLRELRTQADARYGVEQEYLDNLFALEQAYSVNRLMTSKEYYQALALMERQYKIDMITAEMTATEKMYKDRFTLDNAASIKRRHLYELEMSELRDLAELRFAVENEALIRATERATLEVDLIKRKMDLEFQAHNTELQFQTELYNHEVSLLESLDSMRQAMFQRDLQRMGFTLAQAQSMASDRAAFDKKSEYEKAQWAIEQTASVFDNLGQRNKKAFELAKAFNIANAVMNTYAGATKALATYPPPFNFIAAAAVIASGLAQVAAIRSQTYSGRALGGPIVGGQEYLVGERGPEIITAPSGGGTVIPNGEIGGVTNINFNIQTNDARGFDQLLAERKGMIVNMIRQAQMDKGRMATV